ncbi:MAG: GDSL-type esterase/lipase family protein [Clostridiaceae bacterium]
MFKNIKWRLILSLSIIFTIVLVIGFGTALRISSAPPKDVTDTETEVEAEIIAEKTESVSIDKNAYNMLVLGDSLARGTGDEQSRGFSGYFTDFWKTKVSKEIKINNLAVNGDVSTGLLKIVQEEQTLSYIKNSDMIFISIGGNEISKLRNMDIATSTTRIKEMETSYLENLKSIFKIIRDNNPSSMVVFIGLYNPYGKDLTTDKVTILNEWNFQSQQLVSLDPNALYVPTYDLFKYNLESYLAMDKFHPNGTGYQAISNRIAEALKNYK